MHDAIPRSGARIAAVAALALLTLIPNAPITAAHATAEGWSTRAPMPTGREGAAGSFIGAQFYVSHGFGPFIGGDSTVLEAYNPVLDAWTPLAPAVVPRSELVGETSLGQHYAIGGRSNLGCAPTFLPGAVCNTVEIYNPVLNAWTMGAPMPTPRAGLGAAEVNGRIYVVGGRTCGAPYCGGPAAALPTLEIYDPVTNTWSPGPPMPTARMDVYSVTKLGTRIYVIGGYDGTTEVATTEIYDTAAGVWLPGVAMPTARSNAIAGVCEGHIYVIGGTIGGGANVDTVEEFDPSTGLWNAAPSLPAPASELASAHVSGANPVGLPLIMATGSGIFGPGLAQNFALGCTASQCDPLDPPPISTPVVAFDIPCTGGPCQPPATDPVLCPPLSGEGASCLAYGLLAITTDLTGGKLVADHAESRAFVNPGAGGVLGPPPLTPPAPPAAHADAQEAGVSYTNSLLSVSSSTVHSRCDVASAFGPAGVENQAYGRGGVEDFVLQVPPGANLLSAEVLDFEANAYGTAPATTVFMACDLADVDVLAPPTDVAACLFPWTGVNAIVASVTFNEEWGPYLNAAGQWVYGGDVAHIHVTGVAATVDVYVGYVTVAVAGGPPAAPTYVPNAGCAVFCF